MSVSYAEQRAELSFRALLHLLQEAINERDYVMTAIYAGMVRTLAEDLT